MELKSRLVIILFLYRLWLGHGEGPGKIPAGLIEKVESVSAFFDSVIQVSSKRVPRSLVHETMSRSMPSSIYDRLHGQTKSYFNVGRSSRNLPLSKENQITKEDTEAASFSVEPLVDTLPACSEDSRELTDSARSKKEILRRSISYLTNNICFWIQLSCLTKWLTRHGDLQTQPNIELVPIYDIDENGIAAASPHYLSGSLRWKERYGSSWLQSFWRTAPQDPSTNTRQTVILVKLDPSDSRGDGFDLDDVLEVVAFLLQQAEPHAAGASDDSDPASADTEIVFVMTHPSSNRKFLEIAAAKVQLLAMIPGVQVTVCLDGDGVYAWSGNDALQLNHIDASISGDQYLRELVEISDRVLGLQRARMGSLARVKALRNKVFSRPVTAIMALSIAGSIVSHFSDVLRNIHNGSWLRMTASIVSVAGLGATAVAVLD